MRNIFKIFCNLLRRHRHRRRAISWSSSSDMLPIVRLRHPRFLPFFISLVLGLANSYVLSQPTSAATCDDVQFIFARGSGEDLNDQSARAWQESIESVLQDSTLRYSFYELGTKFQGGYQYPAVSVSDSLSGYGNLLGAYISRGNFFEFGKSVNQGVGELKTYLRRTSLVCPQTKFVLGGYSQGAMVLSSTLEELDSNRILYVATFGDPKLYLPEGKGIIPPACLGTQYSKYREHVPDCRAYEGILGSYRPYQPSGYDGKLGTWCNSKDIMCSSGSSINDHTSYTSGGLYAEAARKIRTRIRTAFPEVFQSTPAPWASAAHNVALVFDTTISMRKYLESHTDDFVALSQQITRQNGKVGVVSYRDLAADGYHHNVNCNFSCSQAEIEQSLQELSGYGGGDAPESTLSALLFTLNQLDWQAGATKSIIVFTDYASHSPDLDGTTVQQVIQRSLEIDPVNIYVVTTPESQADYAELVAQTNGASFTLNDDADWLRLNDTLLQRPEAILNNSEYLGLVGDQFTFDASQSHASDQGTLRYDWDLDGDGKFELLDATSEITHCYGSVFNGYIQVRVTDADGRSSTMSALVTVQEASTVLPEISHLVVTQLDASTYQISYQTTAEQVLLSIDDTPAGHFNNTTTSFTLSDTTRPTALHLVPYTSGVGRGEGVTLTLGENSTPSTSSRPVVTGAGASAQTTIPRAPNAGVRPSALYASY